MEENQFTAIISDTTKKGFFPALKGKAQNLMSKVRSNRRIITTILGVFILTASLAVGAYLVQNANKRTKASGVILTLSPSTTAPGVNQTVTVAVAMDTQGLSVCGSDLQIKYDPNLLTLTSWQAGTFLPVVLTPPANSSTSLGNYLTLSVGCDPTAPKTGTGIMATAVFSAKANGSTTISFGPGTDVAAIGQASNNVVGTANPVTINIGGATQPPSITPTPPVPPLPTPSSTPTPTASPIPTATPSVPATVATYKLLRSGNPNALYTIYTSERDTALANGWALGTTSFKIWNTQADSAMVPVYRLHSSSGEFLYTIFTSERDALIKIGWTNDGPVFYAYPGTPRAGTIPVYRLYNNVTHVYAASSTELSTFQASGFKVEGTAFNAASP